VFFFFASPEFSTGLEPQKACFSWPLLLLVMSVVSASGRHRLLLTSETEIIPRRRLFEQQ